MKQYFSLFLIIFLAFFICVNGTSQSSVNPIFEIIWESDGSGCIQFSTNNPEYYGWSWWEFVDNPNKRNTYEIECRRISGNDRMGYGMIFGASNTDDSIYYFLMINNNGYYCILKKQGPNETIIKEWTLSEKLNIGYDAVNTLKVIKKGTTFTVFLNNRQVFKFNDKSINGDRLGYWVSIGDKDFESFPNIPVDIRFRQK